MKFNFITICFLSLIINTVINAMEAPKREPLPLTYQSLLSVLRAQKQMASFGTKEYPEITPDIAHVLETNPDLKKAYETLKNPAQLGLNLEQAYVLYDMLLKLDFNSFKLFMDLIDAIKNQITLEFLKKEQEKIEKGQIETGFWTLKEFLRQEPLDVMPSKALYTIRGDLIRSLINLIKNHAFKEKLSYESFMDDYQLTDILFWQPFDPNNKFYNLFRRFIKELEIGNLKEWDKFEG